MEGMAPALQAALAAFARYEALAARAGVKLRPAPAQPTSCCGRGCNGCVWEGFYGAAGFWIEDAQAALAGNQPSFCGAI